MSLINDALKRAKQAQQEPSPPPVGAPLRPAEPTRPAPAPRSFLLPILVAALLIFGGGILIVVALSRGFQRKRAEPGATQAATVSPKDDPGPAATLPQTAEVPPVTSGSTPSLAIESVPTNAPQPAAATIAPVATQTVITVESSNSVPVVQAPPEPQLPRLQGIVFNPARPTAFLSGKSVVVGGRVGEYTVLAITKQAVTVERAGQTNVLTMEE